LSQILSEILSEIFVGNLSQMLSELLSQILFPKTFAARCSYNTNLGKPVQNFGHDLEHDLGEVEQNFEQHFGHNVGQTRFLIVKLTMSKMLSELWPTFAQLLF